MCQACVNEGRITAEELATRLGAGDKSVVVLGELEPKEFARQVTVMCLSLILEGMDPERVVDEAIQLAASYARNRKMAGAELEAFLAELAEL